MLSFLFRGLTAEANAGAPLFNLVTAKARQPHWYVEGNVPDTIDGRFAVLATIAALAIVRLEQQSEEGNRLSVALTERFIAVMESEHRELGLGDPTLGKTVRRLVGSLSRRTGLWRLAVEGERDWPEAARASLYKEGVSAGSLTHVSQSLEVLWAALNHASFEDLAEGRLQ
jgi:cytochrome b pre-mRNA-processing protein 3